MSKSSPAQGLAGATLVAALATLPFAAQADIYKCVQANGTIGYQGTPCSTHDKPAAHPTAAQLNAQQAAAPVNDKPYDDPYAKGAGSRPSVEAQSVSTGAASAPAQPQATNTSRMIAEVQARNRREAEQQAWKDAHGNDKVVNLGACNAARYNLTILKEQRPVYSYDKKGDRVYVEDKDRAAKIADTQRTISTSCP